MLAKGRSPAALALLSAAVAMAATLVKPHATGTSMAWSYGLILIGICAGHRARARNAMRDPVAPASAPQARPLERSGDRGAPRATA